MMTVAQVQQRVKRALLTGDSSAIAGLVSGGLYPERRFAIHQRHVATSLARALVERFPATVWLIGSEIVTAAARSYVQEQPPAAPCIAEYGEEFPRHLGAQPSTASLPYLTQFATLEWHVGRLALATDDSPNVHDMHLDWSLDELFAVYLTDHAPEQFSLRREDVWLEIRGCRGALQLNRLTREEFLERRAS